MDIDTYVELHAEVFDHLLFPGCGDLLRDYWHTIRDAAMTEPARLSGAAHELEFYGGGR